MKLKVHAYLKSAKTDLKSIILKVSFGYKVKNALTGKISYKPLYYNSGVKVSRKNWNPAVNLPVKRRDIGEIISLEETIQHTYQHLTLTNKEITPELFGRELDIILGREVTEVTSVILICDYIESQIETNTKRSENTRKQYKNLKNHLITFEKSIGTKLTTSNFDRKAFTMFMDEIRSKMNTLNSVWKIEKNLKSVLNDIRRNFRDIDVFDIKAELSLSERTSLISEDNIYLPYEQIQKIIDYKPKDDKYKNAKLILLTLLFTGCRYSDVFKIVPEFEQKDGSVAFQYAKFITDKGKGIEVVVPFLKPLLDAIKENNGKLPRTISNQKFNSYIKDVFEAAKFDEVISLAYTDADGNKVFKSKPFYKMITSHIGRRSFITNLINHIPITILCKITGHTLKDKSIIFKYNKITLVQNAVLFMEELNRVAETKTTQFPIRLI